MLPHSISMDDSKRLLELKEELEKLDQDLDNYCWNVRELTTDEKNDIKELYTLWKSCLNKKIVIDDLHNENIRVSNRITSRNNIIWDDIKQHHSLYFTGCSDSTIIITTKVNHITLEDCKNINIRTTGGSISGIDVINCSNVTHIFESGSIYFMDISNTTECTFILSEKIAMDIMISTTNSYNLHFKTICDNTGVTKNTYKTNMNIFQSYAIYSFHMNEDILSLYIVMPNSNDVHLVQPT